MKKELLVLLLLISAQFVVLSAKTFGIGFSAGEPTGLNGKFHLDKKSAIEATIGWSVRDYYHEYYYDKHNRYYYDDRRNLLYLHVDYRLHHNLVKELYFVYGFGMKMVFNDEPFIGLRMPLGLNYQFKQVPLDLGLDLVPVLDLIPSSRFSFDPAITLRFNIGK